MAAQVEAREKLTYYSDYFSFVGQDGAGRVAFALDNNRGQDEDRFQAEHFAVLHDEHDGWQPLRGSGSYPNLSGALESIPDSEYFQFRGTPASGLVVESPANGLALEMQPILTRLARKRGSDRYRMGSATALLRWKGRTLQGRVIYEFVHLDNWNRLTRTYLGYWKAFHGFYLLMEDPVTGIQGDLYLHRQESRKLSPLMGLVDGFAGSGKDFVHLEGAQVSVREKSWTLGLYQWPLAWSGRWRGSAGGEEIEFDLRLSEKKNITNWVTGGFAMGIVDGIVYWGEGRLEAYGLGEIIE